MVVFDVENIFIRTDGYVDTLRH